MNAHESSVVSPWLGQKILGSSSEGLRLRKLTSLVLAVGALALVGCSESNKEKAATQSAARVNKEEITVHQINAILSQQRTLAPEQAASASRQVLDRLIDQELALQKAQELKLDREPRVVQQVDSARREIIARAYIEKISLGATKPTPEEIKKYYDENPSLFKERRVYSLQELIIEASPTQVQELKGQLAQMKDLNEFLNFIKSSELKFTSNQAVRAAEQMPLVSLSTFAKMKDGQLTFIDTPNGARIIVLLGSRSQPVDEQRAAPAIENFLLNDRKRKLVDDDIKALRTAAKIEYLGEYAKGAASAASASQAKPSVSPLLPPSTMSASAASQPAITPPSASAPVMTTSVGSSASAAPVTPVATPAASVPSAVASQGQAPAPVLAASGPGPNNKAIDNALRGF
jgi:EpsD family peptidyl-prolyl cis-trans isomerase